MALTDEEKERALQLYGKQKQTSTNSKKNASSPSTPTTVNTTRSGTKLQDQKSYTTAQEKARNPVGMPANKPTPKVESAEVLSSTYTPVKSPAARRFEEPVETTPKRDYSYLLSPQDRGRQARSDMMASRMGVSDETLDTIRDKAAPKYGKDWFTEASESGFANIATNLVRTPEIVYEFTPNAQLNRMLYGNSNNPITRLGISEPLKEWQDEKRADAFAAVEDKSKGMQIASQGVTMMVEQIPSLLTSIGKVGKAVDAVSDAVKGTKGIKGFLKSLPSPKKVLPAFIKDATTTVSNPQTWVSFSQILPGEYDAALANGADEKEALVTSLLSAFAQSKIEVGSGFETLPTANAQTVRRAVWDFVKSALDEGREEVVQGVVSGITQKLIFDHDKKMFATEAGEDAVLNAADAWYEGLMGTIFGGFMSVPGAMINAGNAILAQNAPRMEDLIPPESASVLDSTEPKAEPAAEPVVEETVPKPIPEPVVEEPAVEPVQPVENVQPQEPIQQTDVSYESLAEQRENITDEIASLDDLPDTPEVEARREQLFQQLDAVENQLKTIPKAKPSKDTRSIQEIAEEIRARESQPINAQKPVPEPAVDAQPTVEAEPKVEEPAVEHDGKVEQLVPEETGAQNEPEPNQLVPEMSTDETRADYRKRMEKEWKKSEHKEGETFVQWFNEHWNTLKADGKVSKIGKKEYLKKLYGENPLNKNHQNSIINTEFTNGGNNNAERMGETGENPRGNQRVQGTSGKLHIGREGIRTDDVGKRNSDGRHQVLYRVLNENDYVDAVKRQKADVLKLYDYSDDYEMFSKALEEGKESNPKGYMVDGKTVEDLVGSKATCFMTEDGSAGALVTKDGDVEGVFKNTKTSTAKKAVYPLLLTAVANGGIKLDCYGADLVNFYNGSGFEAVGRVEYVYGFNSPMDEAIKQDIASGKSVKEPDVYAMKLRDGVDANIVAKRMGLSEADGGFHRQTQEELDALPLYKGDDSYDEMLSARDELLKAKNDTKKADVGNDDIGSFNAQKTEEKTVEPPKVEETKVEEPKVEPPKPKEKPKAPPRKISIEAELQSMDALGNTKEAQEVSEKREPKKKQKSVEEILKADLTESQIKRYKTRIEAINAFLEGGRDALTSEQQSAFDKLYEYDILKTEQPEELIKKRNEYLKELYGDNVPKDATQVGIGARKGGENPVAHAAAEYGTYDVPKDSYTDYDDYTSRNEVSLADQKTLTKRTVHYGGKDTPYSEAVVEMVMDEVKFSEQKGKYYADDIEIPKAAYDFGKFLEEKGVKYWNNKAEQFPKQWDDKNYVSRFVRNIASSKFGTDKNIELLEESLKNGKFIYERKHNKKVIDKAKKYITLHGFEESMKEWVNFASGNTKVSPDELVDKIALGEMLADVAFEINDQDTATRILMDVAAWGTGMGQGVQVLGQLRKLGKNGEAPFKLDKSNAEYYVDRTLNSLNARYEDKLKGKKIELSDKTRKEWLDAIGTDNEFEVTKKVFGEIANQIPSSWFDRFNSWRYFCMLCAPSTHTKNMASNVAMSGADFLKDVYLARLEKAYQKKHPDYVRTASVTVNSADRKFAKGTYEEANARFGQSGTRYSSEDSGLESLRTNTFSGADYKFAKGVRQFIGKGTDKLVNSVSHLLEAEDTMTKRGIYSRKVAQIMKANGWTEEYFNSGTTQAVRDFEYAQEKAIKDAYKATFNNPNKVQKLLSAWREMPNKTVSDKAKRFALGALVEITFPFKKVSANIPARAIEYSPIGIAQGLLELKFDSKNDDFDATEALNHIAAGAAGSSITLAGAILGFLGLAQLTEGDENEDELKENTGWKNYSLKIGDYYIALDDIAPVTTMLMGGVKLAQEIDELADSYKDGARGSEFASAIVGSLLELATFGIDGILQLDFLTSIKDLMTSYGNETETMDVFGKKLEGVAESLVGQVEPNILRKIMRTIEDDYANAYYYDKTVDTPQWIQNIKSGAMLLIPDRKIEQLIVNNTGKQVDIPGYSDLAKKYDKWGRSINPEDFWVKAANNLGSPFQISKDKTTDVDRELQRIYSTTKNPSVVPSVASKEYTENGKTIRMTAKEYDDYSKTFGQTRYEMLDTLFKSKYYKNLSEEDKVLAIQNAYSLSADLAKDDVFGEPFNSYEGEKVSRTNSYDISLENGLSASAYIAGKAVRSNLPDTKNYTKAERFYDYLIADKTTSAKDDVLLLEALNSANFDLYRTATDDYDEMMMTYSAQKEGASTAEDIELLTEKLGGDKVRAYALMRTSTGTKKYVDGELKNFGANQVKKAQKLLDSGKLSGEKIAIGARAVTGLDDYFAKTKKNYIAVLMEVGFTEKEAEIFYNGYGW